MCYQHETDLVQSAMAPFDARKIVRRVCTELHVDELADTATLLTSELVTNAIRHAPGPLRLAVACTNGELVISVHDTDPRPPLVRRVRNRAVSGRGLALVDELADHWGCQQLADHRKAVWFSLRVGAPPVVSIPASRNAS